MFSKACEYGFRATIYIGKESIDGKRVSLKAVAKAIDSPVAFTAKILQLLAQKNILTSSHGPKGGYELVEETSLSVTLYHIVLAIDGDNVFNGCGLGLKQCNENMPCPLHFQFKEIRDSLKQMLTTTTVKELTEGIHSGLAFLKC